MSLDSGSGSEWRDKRAQIPDRVLMTGKCVHGFRIESWWLGNAYMDSGLSPRFKALSIVILRPKLGVRSGCFFRANQSHEQGSSVWQAMRTPYMTSWVFTRHFDYSHPGGTEPLEAKTQRATSCAGSLVGACVGTACRSRGLGTMPYWSIIDGNGDENPPDIDGIFPWLTPVQTRTFTFMGDGIVPPAGF